MEYFANNMHLIEDLRTILKKYRNNIVEANTADTLIASGANADELDRAISNLERYGTMLPHLDRRRLRKGAAVIVPYNAPSYALFGMSLPAALLSIGKCENIHLHFPAILKKYSSLIRDVFSTHNEFRKINIDYGNEHEFMALSLYNTDIDLITVYGGLWVDKYIDIARETSTAIIYEGAGNNAALLLNSSNIENDLDRILEMAYYLSGQAAVCFNRLIVDSDIDRAYFVNLITDKLKRFPVSQNPFSDAIVTPIGNKKIISGVEQRLSEAVNNGASVINHKLDESSDKALLHPTAVIDVTSDMKVWQEDNFAPVISVIFADKENMIELCNDTNYRVTTSVYGEQDEAEIIAQKLKDKWPKVLVNKNFIDMIPVDEGYLGEWGGYGDSFFFMDESTGWQPKNDLRVMIDYYSCDYNI